jgi:hypothetical protein
MHVCSDTNILARLGAFCKSTVEIKREKLTKRRSSCSKHEKFRFSDEAELPRVEKSKKLEKSENE